MKRPDFVEAAWRKSRASSDGQSCVEVARAGIWTGVRDSKDASGPILAPTAATPGVSHPAELSTVSAVVVADRSSLIEVPSNTTR